jgi:DNA-binding beta-propeller fold protein YncE
VSDNGSGGSCADLPGAPLNAPVGIALSPDGKTVYVAGANDVTVLDRNSKGQLSYAGCVSDDGSGGLCADAPGTPLTGAVTVAVSPDGKSLYAGGDASSTVSVYDRAPAGQLTYAGCVSDSGSGGLCADLPGDPIARTWSLRVSPDGNTVYASGYNSKAIAVLDRAAAGQLTYAGCVSNNGSGGRCADLPGDPLTGGGGLALSPDGGSLYAAAFDVSTVTHLFRKTAPDTLIETGPDEGAAIAAPRPTFGLVANQANANFECSLDGAAFGPCPSPATLGPLADGPHKLAARAVTGGDPDPTPATRSFSVDTTGPSVTITKAPKRKIKTTKRRVRVSFTFTSPEPGVSSTCRLDRRPASPCNASIGYLIGRGKHTFTVSAADKLGNRGPAAIAQVEVVKKRKGRR